LTLLNADVRSNQSVCGSVPALLTATVVVILGTAWVDPSRLWLLFVPATFLIMAFAGGTLVDRAIGGLPAEADAPPMLTVAVHVGVGLACLSSLAVLSALGGMLWIAGIAAVLLLAYGLFRVVRAGLRFRPVRGVLPAAAGGLAMGGAWLVAWLWATIPPTFFDELGYHLVVPQRALLTGKLQTTPWVFFNLMPHASDLLLSWGMAFGGDLGARANLFGLWVACSLGAWGLAEAIAWPRVTTWAAPLVAGALAASPTLWFLATLPFADTCLAVAVVTAIAMLVSPQSARRPWAPLGLVLGLAATVKLTGLYWVMAALAAALVAGWSWSVIGRVSLVAVASVAPWWIRAAVHTGNPIYPAGFTLLGGHPWSDESQARAAGDIALGAGDLGLMGLLRLPLDLVQQPERFGSAADAGVLAYAATFLVLASPALLRWTGIGGRERRTAGIVSVFVLMAGIGWVITSPTSRFFAPAFVISLAMLAGWALFLGRIGQMVAVLVLLAAGAWGTWRFIEQHTDTFSSFDVALGRERADDYLVRQLDHFRAARFVRETLPADARILFIGETRPYYFAREAMAPSAYDRHPLHRWVLESSSPKALAVRLADEGFTHVVLNVHEFKRIHDKYGVLAFSGEGAEEHDRRLKALPGALRLLFASSGVYVFEVP
jgi:hypothetical protein